MEKRLAVYIDGKPDSLESSANDALTWLEFFEDKAANDRGCRISDENLAKLREIIASLQQHLADVDIQFVDTGAT